MKSYRVVFSPEAELQIAGLYRYIAGQASPAVAARYTDDLVTFCEGLTRFPNRGIQRGDIRPGLRITSHRKRTAIAFVVKRSQIAILGIFHGGQNYETLLQEDEGKAE